MKKRRIHELPDGLKNRMLRLTAEYAVLSDRDVAERVKALDVHNITYDMWQKRSYFLMVAINQKLVKEGKAKKYEFTS